ncbi:MAG: periplasmic heavy metal sensor [Thiotrichales bacterium]|nr:periplasmic heavy metal sensor [Thiotrichales bacterium]
MQKISKFLKVSVLAIGMVAVTVHADTGDFKPAKPVVTLMPILMDNLDILNLTPEQLTKVRSISRKSFEELNYLNAEYHLVKSELKEVLFLTQPMQEKANQLAQQLSKMEAKRLQLSIECAEELKQILTPEQHKELISLANF